MIASMNITDIDRLPLALQEIARAMPYLTSQDGFKDVSRGKPLPHRLDSETKVKVGMARDTWELEVVAAPIEQSEYPSAIAVEPCELANPLTRSDGTTLRFHQLMALAETHGVKFPKVMTCLNLAEPLGMGVWEGVPLREIIALARPQANVRRVYFHGYHNDDPGQIFRSSLSINRVLESPPSIPPAILAYKLNGEWLSSERGGPVRMIVPETYGFKNVKWLQRITLTNDYQCNDTYAGWNNDPDSPLKSCAHFQMEDGPMSIPANIPVPLKGIAQVGLNGVAAVEVAALPSGQIESMAPYFDDAPWTRAFLLPPPAELVAHFVPARWPAYFTNVQWVMEHPPLTPGKWDLICRTIDDRGVAQPRPRPFAKSGSVAIRHVSVTVG